jgi:hypothetical protein
MLAAGIKKADTSLDYIPIWWSPCCHTGCAAFDQFPKKQRKRGWHIDVGFTPKRNRKSLGKALIIENRRWTYGLSDAAFKISQIRAPIPITLDQSIRTREHMRLTMPSNSIPLAVFGTRTVCT